MCPLLLPGASPGLRWEMGPRRGSGAAWVAPLAGRRSRSCRFVRWLPCGGSQVTRIVSLPQHCLLRNSCEAFWSFPDINVSGAQQLSPAPATPCLRGDGCWVRGHRRRLPSWGRAGSERVAVGEGSPWSPAACCLPAPRCLWDSAIVQARACDLPDVGSRGIFQPG